MSSPDRLRTTIGIGYTVLGALLLAVMDAVSKLLVADYPPFQILWVRLLLFALIAGAVAVAKRGVGAFHSAVPGTQLLRAVAHTTTMVTLILSFSYMALVEVHAVLAVGPLIVTAFSALFLGERVGPRRWAAVCFGFIGVLIILRPGFGVFQATSLIALLAAFLFGVYQVLTRLVGRHDGSETTLLYTGAVGTAAMSVLAPLVWVTPDLNGLLLMLLGGLLAVGAHYCVAEALRRVEASTAQPYNYTMLVWAAGIGFLVWGDLPDWPTSAGALVVIASGLYAFRRARRTAGGERRAGRRA